ncbi:MAG: DUF1178 family protein [Pseudomonadota bacterium]
MIKYNLRCTKGHDFESWFSSGADYDRLEAGGLLSCAICGSANVSKAVMAPQVSTAETAPSLSGPASPAEQMLRDLRQRIEQNADNVGKNFATEARNIHQGTAPNRPIYGQANGRDARALLEDGVPVIPLPWDDKKQN